MTRRALLWVPVAACLRAGDSGDEIRALLDSAVDALRNRDEKQFLAAFEPAMKGYRELGANVRGLLRDADVTAFIQIAAAQLDWTLEISAHDLSAGTTRRQVKAAYTTSRSSGKLRIASFEPVALFAPPHGREAWDAISGVARDLQVASRSAEGRDENSLPALLARFDRAMTGYAELETNLKALTSIWIVEPDLQLTSNEGSDESRSLEMDWVMTLTDPEDRGKSLRKQAVVKCTVQKRGKQWLIVSLAPLEFFAPPQL